MPPSSLPLDRLWSRYRQIVGGLRRLRGLQLCVRQVWRRYRGISNHEAVEAQGIINFGRVDILVNKGVYEFSPIESFTEERFNKIFNVNRGPASRGRRQHYQHWFCGQQPDSAK